VFGEGREGKEKGGEKGWWSESGRGMKGREGPQNHSATLVIKS